MEHDLIDYEREAREFINLNCQKIAVGNGDREMRLWQFEEIYRRAKRIQPDIILVPAPIR